MKVAAHSHVEVNIGARLILSLKYMFRMHLLPNPNHKCIYEYKLLYGA